MTTFYLLTAHYDYDGDDIAGLFASVADAQAYAARSNFFADAENRPIWELTRNEDTLLAYPRDSLASMHLSIKPISLMDSESPVVHPLLPAINS